MAIQTVLPLYIDGQFVSSDHTFPNINPVTRQTQSLVSEAGKVHVDAAVAAARRAVDGEWGEFSPAERAQLLRKIADGIEARLKCGKLLPIFSTNNTCHFRLISLNPCLCWPISASWLKVKPLPVWQTM